MVNLSTSSGDLPRYVQTLCCSHTNPVISGVTHTFSIGEVDNLKNAKKSIYLFWNSSLFGENLRTFFIRPLKLSSLVTLLLVIADKIENINTIVGDFNMVMKVGTVLI